ncbi:hypothetical protein MNBD_ACTINO01-1649 [hydrothermal vent metagenome]|uniref:Uncharacterized protein n=1 Tax=hydrothermal vent metagenome TaxID=652676 RepID=A0A3B0SQ85_9ZZZZ
MNLYEQIKDDLGYLQLERAAEVFATLAEEARHNDMTHIEFLGRLIAVGVAVIHRGVVRVIPQVVPVGI